MIELKIDENRILVGDIWVNVDIEFKPMMYPRDVKESSEIDRINAHMSSLGMELQVEIKKIINAKFEAK